MNNAERRFLDNITSLPSLNVPKLHRAITGIIIFLVLAAGLILYFTPWIQTAYGTGMVDSLDPKDRTQPINALVDGQVKQWHVRERQQVKAGEPIEVVYPRWSSKVEAFSFLQESRFFF